MSSHIIDCLSLSENIRHKASDRVNKLISSQNIRPCLVTILVGDNVASHVYVRNKINACKKVGINSIKEHYSSEISESFILNRIKLLNEDSNVHGILVQLPLPEHIDIHKVARAILPIKDVDGFNPINIGLLTKNQRPFFKPCTPYGIMKVFEHEKILLCGTNVVIVGTSNIVGRPLAMMLLNEGSTVVLCNSNTKNLGMITKYADILISATGKPDLINKCMIKPGVIIIDVGINRNHHGKLSGDVDFHSVKSIAGSITPVPGGVGLMTVTMLLINTIKAAYFKSKNLEYLF
ncbi:MAG: bifunctional methylenetetrahydrofolate dehydrogenase/methenyltetrahydrofolate cyclohydrolase [Bordetella sp.]|nr:MAG: bifunctional methylenetetrahydrofolate dehydrogenase/methenyltetrahydrofolate cyclohydrolase [Bordetella sp.]